MTSVAGNLLCLGNSGPALPPQNTLCTFCWNLRYWEMETNKLAHWGTRDQDGNQDGVLGFIAEMLSSLSVLMKGGQREVLSGNWFSSSCRNVMENNNNNLRFGTSLVVRHPALSAMGRRSSSSEILCHDACLANLLPSPCQSSGHD